MKKKSCRSCAGKGWIGVRKPEINIEGLFMRKCIVCRGSGCQRGTTEPTDSYFSVGGKL